MSSVREISENHAKDVMSTIFPAFRTNNTWNIFFHFLNIGYYFELIPAHTPRRPHTAQYRSIEKTPWTMKTQTHLEEYQNTTHGDPFEIHFASHFAFLPRDAQEATNVSALLYEYLFLLLHVGVLWKILNDGPASSENGNFDNDSFATGVFHGVYDDNRHFFMALHQHYEYSPDDYLLVE